MDRHAMALENAYNRIKESPVMEHIAEIYLYGSLARETVKWDSDIDLLIVLDELERDNADLRRNIIELKGTISGDDLYNPEVDIKIAFGDSWKSSKSLFYTTILDEGKLLWKRN